MMNEEGLENGNQEREHVVRARRPSSGPPSPPPSRPEDPPASPVEPARAQEEAGSSTSQPVASTAPETEDPEPSVHSNHSTASAVETDPEPPEQAVVPRIRARAEWKPWQIKAPWVSFLFLCQTAIVASVSTLLGISITHSGFASVSGLPTFLEHRAGVFQTLWMSGFAWRAVPSLVASLYGMLWRSVIAAASDRQPFVSLYGLSTLSDANTTNARARREVETGARLDYNTYNGLTQWWHALRNRHVTLGGCMLLSLLWGVAAMPTASYLITEAKFVFNTTEVAAWTKTFDGTAFTAQTDLRQVMEVVMAALLYGGAPPPWTYGEFAFAPLSLPAGLAKGVNVTVPATGLSGDLDCRVVPEAEYELNATETSYAISAVDRGCRIEQSQTVVSDAAASSFFVATWATASCGLAARRSRLAIFAGAFPPAGARGTPPSPTNISLVSCIPSYWATAGNLTLTFGVSDASPSSWVLNAFSPAEGSSPRDFAPWYLFEHDLHLFTGFSPSARVEAGDFGQKVYALSAGRVRPAQPLEAGALAAAAANLFSAVFASLAVMFLFRDDGAAPARATECVRSASETRLVVVLPAACVLLALMGLMMAGTVATFWCARRRTVLVEEPVGLVGKAKLLREQELGDYVDGLIAEDERRAAEKPVEGREKAARAKGSGEKAVLFCRRWGWAPFMTCLRYCSVLTCRPVTQPPEASRSTSTRS